MIDYIEIFKFAASNGQPPAFVADDCTDEKFPTGERVIEIEFASLGVKVSASITQAEGAWWVDGGKIEGEVDIDAIKNSLAQSASEQFVANLFEASAMLLNEDADNREPLLNALTDFHNCNF